ncbi:MAG TPA: LCCL domain-containing protein [Gemmataceae bacterium]|nr:LCCL domain-containing protein [Gemmataceae bacterium]
MNRLFLVGAFLLAPWAVGSVRGDDLPADAKKLVDNYDKDAAEIQARADRLIKERREELVSSLRALAEKYRRDGRVADADAVRGQIELVSGAVKPEADPGNLVGYRGQNGKAFYFEVTGNKNAGQVWGSGLYTDDSALAAAAVHAGALTDGQKGIVKVTILPGAASYSGSEKNGVVTGDWGGWDGSYRIQALGARSTTSDVLPDPGTLTNYRGQNGQSFLFEVTGNKNAGSVWGSGLYTDDSALAAVVVHAGILADGEKGVVRVTIAPGADSYEGSQKNGVASADYGAWVGSYRVKAVKK